MCVAEFFVYNSMSCPDCCHHKYNNEWDVAIVGLALAGNHQDAKAMADVVLVDAIG